MIKHADYLEHHISKQKGDFNFGMSLFEADYSYFISNSIRTGNHTGLWMVLSLKYLTRHKLLPANVSIDMFRKNTDWKITELRLNVSKLVYIYFTFDCFVVLCEKHSDVVHYFDLIFSWNI